MPKPLVSDQKFIELWNKHQSAAKISKIIGTNERGVHARRRRLENRRSIQLQAKGFNPDLVKYNYRSLVHKVQGPVIVCSDAHCWSQDELTPAYWSMLHLIEELKPKIVVMNGDLLDGSSISRFPSTGEAIPTMQQELEAAQHFMRGIEDAAPRGCNLVFTVGNHDQRWATKVASFGSEFSGISGFELCNYFEAWNFCWSLVLNKGIDGGETIIKHRLHNGIHSAHNNAVKSGINVVTGHTHALKAVPYSDYRGRRWAVETGMIGPMPLDAGSKMLYAEDGISQNCVGFCILHYTADHKLLPPELVETIGKEVYWRGKPINWRRKK